LLCVFFYEPAETVEGTLKISASPCHRRRHSAKQFPPTKPDRRLHVITLRSEQTVKHGFTSPAEPNAGEKMFRAVPMSAQVNQTYIENRGMKRFGD